MAEVLKPEERKLKIAKLREKHEGLFKAIGVNDALFIPKMAYRPSGKDELYIGLFNSELSQGKDIYTEYVSSQLESEDTTRSLYVLKYNPHYKEEYEMTSPDSGAPRYLIPVSELVKCTIDMAKTDTAKLEKKISTKDFDIIDPEIDPPFSTMTLRDYACIKLGVAESHKEWLNEIIMKSKKVK